MSRTNKKACIRSGTCFEKTCSNNFTKNKVCNSKMKTESAHTGLCVFLLNDSKLACIPVVDVYSYHHPQKTGLNSWISLPFD